MALVLSPRARFALAHAVQGRGAPIGEVFRFASGLYFFADSDLKFDQPQTEVVFDRDKLRAQGVDLSQVGRDLQTLLGGDYVNRFSIQGRSYKVIPQVKRSERLTPDQLASIHVTGADASAKRTIRPFPVSAT